jgi:pimeloyl-ACP methyl ester carboxylesterase
MNRSLIDAVTISASLARIEQPTLIIAGAEDRLVDMSDTARAADTLPNAELAVLPDCGHVPHEECPDLVKAIIADWLRHH